jgi:heme/copper-type cytochrome/quinol oxidase subunit 4
MHYLVDTEAMQAEGMLSPDVVAVIKERSRAAMVALGVNTVLAGGIAASAGGFIFWLADTLAVAITGSIFLAIGLLILLRAGPLYRMLGNAAGLIGGGMLAGGATLKLLELASPEVASGVLLTVGAIVALTALWFYRRTIHAGFLIGAIVLLGAGMHLVGLYAGLQLVAHSLAAVPAAHLYATLVLLALGYLLDFRLITALAIMPFAQVLDTSTGYFHAMYVFYSPEPTLSILQMTLALVAALWLVQNRGARIGRQAGIFAIMAFIVGNLCFLVGSLWGDVVGESFLDQTNWDNYETALTAWRGKTLVIGSGVYSVVWALALAAMAGYAAYRLRRGLFNATLTFAAIHFYTQMFESFADEPLAYVIGGLAAVPLAWGMWRVNEYFRARQAAY